MSAHPEPGPTSRTALAKLDDAGRTEYWASLALRNCKGVGARSIRRLVDYFGTAYEAVYHVPDWGDAGVPPSKGAPLQKDAWRRAARPEWEDCRDLDGHVILWTNPLYPSQLRELPDAPVLLYGRGNLELLKNPCVGIVGSRASSARKRVFTRNLARDLSGSGITVISGLARGIDREAHVGALEEIGSSIAVLGAGIDVVYPPDNADLYRRMSEEGLILSEFPPGTKPDSRHFPIRNRIISGISLGVIVVEAAVRSGSLVTAKLALEQNRSVFAVPPSSHVPVLQADEPVSGTTGKVEHTEDGCLLLLEQGALPCAGAADVILDLLPHLEQGLKKQKGDHGDMESSDIAHEDSALRFYLRPATPAKPIPAPPSTGPKTTTSENPATRRSRAKRPEPPEFPPLPPGLDPGSPEGRVILTLREHGPLSLDDLSLLADMTEAGKLNALLVVLEIRGLVRRLPGARYEACL